MSSLKLPVNDEARACMDEIAQCLTALFDVSTDEAVDWINRFWRGQEFLSETAEVSELRSAGGDEGQ